MNNSYYLRIVTTLCLYLFSTRLCGQSYYIEQLQHNTFVTDSDCFSAKAIDEDRIGYVFCIDHIYYSDKVVDPTNVMFRVDFEMKLNNTCSVDTILLKNASIFSIDKSIVFTKSDIENYDFYIEALAIILKQSNYCYFFEKAHKFERPLCITESFFIPITFLPQDTIR